MIPIEQFTLVHSHESILHDGTPLGVKIYITPGKREITDSERNVAYKAGELMYNELWKQHTLLDPLSKANADKEKEEILALFGDRKIFVEEIPNGYCNQPCCCNKPWFIVTTIIGRFKIGWRKRVINIDWTDTIQKKRGDELFPDENVTKSATYDDKNYIHAWDYDKAKGYIDTIHKGLSNAEKEGV